MIEKMAKSARVAAMEMARCSTSQKNEVLLRIADKIEKNAFDIKEENKKDLARAEEMRLSNAMIDRLTVKDATIKSMSAGLREVARLTDPVGTLSQTWLRPNGLSGIAYAHTLRGYRYHL